MSRFKAWVRSHWKATTLIMVVILASISLYGIGLLTRKVVPHVTSIATLPPLELKLELEKTEFELGEPVNIVVSLRNTGNSTVTVVFSRSGSWVSFAVIRTATGERVWVQGNAVIGSEDELSLSRDEQVIQTYIWNQSTAISEWEPTRGSFRIVGKTAAPISIGSMEPIFLYTPPITVLLAKSEMNSVTSVATAPPLELKLGLEKTEFLQSEPINITVSLRNIGNTTIIVHFNRMGSYVMFLVFDINGKLMWEYGRAVLAATSKISLIPNEQMSRTFTWTQIIWTRVGDTVLDERQAPKGTYYIVGAPGTTAVAVDGIGELQDRLDTPPIKITIE